MARASAAADVTFQAELTAYALVMRLADEANHYFRLSEVAPNGCRWIVLRTGERAAAVPFMLEHLRKRTLQLTLTGPIEPFRADKACHVREISFGLT